MTRLRSDEGAVLITVALSALVVFGLVGLGMDGSRMYNERRHAQNAADDAALAGAVAHCEGGGVVSIALTSASANGFDSDGITNTVAVVNPYSGDPSKVEVTVTSTLDSTFASVLGWDDLTVAARAVASCDSDTGGIGVAIFASGPGCGASTLDAQSSSIVINGGLHSNDGLHMNSASTTVTGPANYVGTATGNGIPAQAGPTGHRDYPVVWDIEDYAPGGARAVAAGGNYHYFPGDVRNSDVGVPMGIGGTMDPGLYFAEGSVELQRVEGNVTIVSRGPQTYRGELDLENYEPDLVMFTTAPGHPDCGYDAIRFDAASGQWRGVIYAPNGQVSMSTSSAASQHGAIVAYTVDISGSGFSITYDPAQDDTRGPFVQLEE